ncbi:MAG TPA: superoxide dismutase family protein, partial [Caulobacteraceae bacterium]|nr:superoxide dismutase family protein [Caulobacteraceae bacterium]
MRRLPIVLAAVLAASAATAQTAPTTADIKDGAGVVIGKVTLTAAPQGVLMRVEAKGLAPGWHGLHFHEKADCSKSDFTSAGGHTHGAGDRVHGLLNPN